MLASALKEVRNVPIDADAKTIQKVMDWMDRRATTTEPAGMVRLRGAQAPWQRG